MQAIILFIFFSLITIKLIIRDRLANRLLSIYIVWWMSLLFISTFNLYKLNPVSDSAYLLLLLNVAMFTTGLLASCSKQRSFTTSHFDLILNHGITFNNKSNKQRVVLPLSLLTVLLGYYSYKYLNIINTQGVLEARNLRFFVGGLFGSTFEVMFYNYLIESVSYVMLFVISFRLVWGKVDKLLLSTAILYITFFAIIGAGRGILVELGFYLVYLYLIKKIILYKSTSSKSRFVFRNPINKKISFIVAVLVLLYSVTVYLTGLRTGLFELTLESFTEANSIFMEHISVYLTGSFRAFDYAFHNYNESLGFNFGRLTFAGLDEIIGNFYRLAGADYQIMNHISGAITGPNITIGKDYEFNALYTCVYNYYFDFGVPGVILFPFLFGFIYHRIILTFERNPSTASLFMLIFVSVASISSVLTWKFQAPAALVALFGAYLFSCKFKKISFIQFLKELRTLSLLFAKTSVNFLRRTLNFVSFRP